MKRLAKTLLFALLTLSATGFATAQPKKAEVSLASAFIASVVSAPQCVGIGDRCDFSSDCCSGFCTNQTCMLSGGNGSGDSCLYAGEACGSDGECCSGYCAAYGACQ